MRKELLHAANPWRARLAWATIYILVLGGTLITLYLMLQRVQTFSLPSGGIQLSVPYSTYLVGETISFTVKNNFNSPIYVNNGCPNEPLNVYRQENGSWVRIHDTTSLSNCATQDRTVMVPANSSMTATFANWPQLFDTPGKYRIVMMVQYYNALPYQDFTVIAKPAPYVAAAPKTTHRSSQTSSGSDDNHASSTTNTTSTSSNTSSNSSASYTPQTYTVDVNSSGVYSSSQVTLSNITLHVTDSLKFVFLNPPDDTTVRTNFNPSVGATTHISLSQDNPSATVKFSSAGSWTFSNSLSSSTGTIKVQ